MSFDEVTMTDQARPGKGSDDDPRRNLSDKTPLKELREPEPTEMGYCRRCDVDIYRPRQPSGLCPTCEAMVPQ